MKRFCALPLFLGTVALMLLPTNSLFGFFAAIQGMDLIDPSIVHGGSDRDCGLANGVIPHPLCSGLSSSTCPTFDLDGACDGKCAYTCVGDPAPLFIGALSINYKVASNNTQCANTGTAQSCQAGWFFNCYCGEPETQEECGNGNNVLKYDLDSNCLPPH